MNDFTTRLRRAQQQTGSVLCVGLDPDLDRLPPHLLKGRTPAEAVVDFCRAVIKSTAPFACAYKLNFAFFEVLGADGWHALRAVRAALPPGALSIADAKRGDIGNSARFYARSVFDDLGFDAVTVSPYMGGDSVAPFLAYPGRAVFILGRTSNPGGSDFQTLASDGKPLYLHVAEKATAWDREAEGTAGLVAGATDTDALAELRRACPTLPFLIPGVGAQGGDAEAVMAAAHTPDGPILVNSSRAILYASAENDYARAAGEAARASAGVLGV